MGRAHKSRPTIFSKTELFPLDCEPTTAICGRSMGFCTYLEDQREAPPAAWGDSRGGRATYSYGSEDILELVDECDQARVVDINATGRRLADNGGQRCRMVSIRSGVYLRHGADGGRMTEMLGRVEQADCGRIRGCWKPGGDSRGGAASTCGRVCGCVGCWTA